MKTVLFVVVTIQPTAFRRLQQRVSARDIGFDEGIRPVDGAIDMRLCSKMHQRVDILRLQQLCYQSGIADIALYKSIVGITFTGSQISLIAGIGERIQHNHAILRVGAQPVMNKVGTDKTGTAGN